MECLVRLVENTTKPLVVNVLAVVMMLPESLLYYLLGVRKGHSFSELSHPFRLTVVSATGRPFRFTGVSESGATPFASQLIPSVIDRIGRVGVGVRVQESRSISVTVGLGLNHRASDSYRKGLIIYTYDSYSCGAAAYY